MIDFWIAALLLLILPGCNNLEQQHNKKKDSNVIMDSEWGSYGGDPGGTRYSSLDQINSSNVKYLKVAWTYQTGENPKVAEGYSLSECTPLMVDNTLFVCTPLNRVIALNPGTGKEIWKFDPKVPDHHYANGPTCRGVSFWKDPKKKAEEHFSRLVFIGTNDGRLISLDAKSGKPNLNFGKNGVIDLKIGVGEQGSGNYQVTSPPAIINDLVVVGSAINDNWHQNEAKGTVRAYEASTGKLRWSWDPIPRDPKDSNYKTWENDSAVSTGAANVWSIISVDAQRDLIFLPTSSPSVDYYGGERLGENLWANSVVALKGSTGEFVWGFQVVHHDIWDYDIPAQPTLLDINVKGEIVPALIQGTKMGNIFVLNRENGKPVWPVEEKNVPQDAITGEMPWLTQPFPTLPEPIVPQYLSYQELWGIDEEDLKYAQETYKTLHYEGIFTPGSEQGTLVFPGNIGGIAWGGVAVDPKKQMLITNTNRLGAIIKLIPRERAENKIQEPGHPEHVVARELKQVEKAAMNGTPYVLFRSYFVSEKGIPCNPPPWGALTAIHLSTGAKLWEVPLGILHELKGNPHARKWGSPNYGGPLVTAGDLVVIAATMDDTLRIFDIETGVLLWESSLPAGGQATPMTYAVEDKQYIVINAGGHGRLKTTPGDYFIAFALPENFWEVAETK